MRELPDCCEVNMFSTCLMQG